MKEIVLDYKQHSDLFDNIAKEWADKVYEDREYIPKKDKKGYEKQNFKKDPTKSTQIRNFYDYVLQRFEESEKDPDQFDEVLPFVKMINSKVEYAYGRENISKSFKEMMTNCVNQTNTYKELRTFKLFFEAFVGFYKGK